MQGVKLMLTVIAVLAIASGVLSFNLKFNRKVCTAIYENGCPTFCPNLTLGYPHPATGTQYCYKVVSPNTTNCTNINCETTSTTIGHSE